MVPSVHRTQAGSERENGFGVWVTIGPRPREDSRETWSESGPFSRRAGCGPEAALPARPTLPAQERPGGLLSGTPFRNAPATLSPVAGEPRSHARDFEGFSLICPL